MSYTPQPGTTPFRAIQVLMAATESLTTAQLAEALDIEPSSIFGMLIPAEREGLISRTPWVTPSGRASFKWSRGDGASQPPMVDDEPLVRRIIPAKPAEAIQLKPGAFNASLWIDGSLILAGVPIRSDGVVVLDPAQTARLRALVAA